MGMGGRDRVLHKDVVAIGSGKFPVVELVKRQPIQILNRCSECNSSNTYYRSKTKDSICRKCGKVFAVKKDKKKKGV